MKPIDGVVLNNKEVQIRGGTILNVEKHPLMVNQQIKVGERVKICWNFTENCVRNIVPSTDFHPIHDVDMYYCKEEENEHEDEHIEDDDLIRYWLEQP